MPVSRSLLCLAFLAATTAAQRPSPWAALAVPTGVNPAAVSQIGKLVVYRESQMVSVFSAFTRRWHQLAVGTGATLRQANDWLLVQDGTTWTAFSSMRGQFAPLQVSATAAVINSPTQRNDSILLVVDANQLHAFSGFVGRWVSRPLGPMTSVAVQRHTAVLADGMTLLGMSAFKDHWTAQPITALTTLVFADGTTGVAEVGSTLYGYSAQLDRWTSAQALSGTVTRQVIADQALWYNGSQTLAFSGLQGTFAGAPTGPAANRVVDRQLAVIPFGGVAHAYSAVTGGWSLIPFASTGTILADSVTALLRDGNVLHGYSAVHGRFFTLGLDSSTEGVTRAVAAAVDRATSQPWLFSALTGQWVAAPAGVQPGLPWLSAQTALLRTNSGYAAFSARTGSFVGLPLAAAGTVEVDPNSSLTAVWNGADLHVFEARRDLWLSRPRSSTAGLPVEQWRTTMLAVDGNEVVGFGSQAGAIETAPLPAAYLSFKASSEVGHVITPGAVLAFGSVGGVTSMWQFPEFRRVFTAGATWQMQVSMPAGSFAFVGGGSLGAPTVVPGLGTVLLGGPVATSFTGTLPGEDRAVLELSVPVVAALIGSEWFFQALVLPNGGQPYITSAANVMVR